MDEVNTFANDSREQWIGSGFFEGIPSDVWHDQSIRSVKLLDASYKIQESMERTHKSTVFHEMDVEMGGSYIQLRRTVLVFEGS